MVRFDMEILYDKDTNLLLWLVGGCVCDGNFLQFRCNFGAILAFISDRMIPDLVHYGTFGHFYRFIMGQGILLLTVGGKFE